jgi:hypothetical protein
VLLHNLEISQESGVSERRLGPGVIVVGGSLSCDLVIPSLLDSELCELILPSLPDKPFKVTALVEGLVVNGRELRMGQSLASPRMELSADGVTLRLGASIDENDALEGAGSGGPDMVAAWMDRARRAAGISSVPREAGPGPVSPSLGPQARASAAIATLGRHPLAGVVRANPGYGLIGLAGGLALLAFLISGWPSARFTPPDLAGLTGAGLGTASPLLAEIRRRLVAADLSGAVKAEMNGDAVRLTGMVDPSQGQRLAEMLRLVPQAAGAQIRNEVSIASAEAATGVEAVVLMPARGVVVTGGRLYREGQTLPTGWMVQQIEAGQVVMKRDGISFVLPITATAVALPPAADPLVRKAPVAARPAGTGFTPVSSPPREPPRQARTLPEGAVTIRLEPGQMGGPYQPLPQAPVQGR